jgi:transcriptional regulator with XRE-family HTH domain
MSINNRREKIIKDLKDKEYRDAFVEEHINTGVPFQIRALREQKGREWSQKELGMRTRMAQETISRIEDPNYGKLTLKTLKRLASAFDVALMVRFISFSELVEWELHLTPQSLEATSFENDPYFNESREEDFPEEVLTAQQKHLLDDNRSSVIITAGPKINEVYDFRQKETKTPAHNLGVKS